MQIFIQAAKSEEDFLICPKLPKMIQKLLNGELNELSDFFYFRTRGIGILRSRPQWSRNANENGRKLKGVYIQNKRATQ